MSEFDLENFENQENASFAEVKSVPKKKKHIGLKAVSFLLAMTIVSGSSIMAYRYYEDTHPGEKTSVSEETNSKSSPLDVKKLSITNGEASGEDILSTEEAVEKVLPSVVGIKSEFTVKNDRGGYYFGFGGSTPATQEASATGTGVVISSDGYIVTNAHVIYDTEHGGGLSESITVLLNGSDNYDAEVIGYDTDCDLAVLKIKADDLTAAQFGDSSILKLGEGVTAIGNPLGFDLMNTVTSGIISGIDRRITINDKSMTLIQTDAAINSGNSGGPLINKYGQVIGINSSKMSASYSETSIEGIGFAIPSNEVSRIVDDLMEYGYVTGKPQLGISCSDVTEEASRMYNIPMGVYVTSVVEGSAADKAGLVSGDVITEINGEEVTTADELNAKKNQYEAGEEIEVTYIRNGKTKTISVTLDEIKRSEES